MDRRADYLGALREPADLAVADSGVGDLEAASEAEGLDLAVAGREVSAVDGEIFGGLILGSRMERFSGRAATRH